MGETNIRHSLAKLQEHIQKMSANDDEGRAILNTLHHNIQNVLSQPEPLKPEYTRSLGERLAVAIQHFEATHPNLIHLLNTAAMRLSEGGL